MHGKSNEIKDEILNAGTIVRERCACMQPWQHNLVLH